MATDSIPERRDWAAAEQRPVVPKVEARQGVTGHNVRYVLGFSVVVLVIAFVVIWLVYFG
jgi:hypothetical protein